MRIHTLLCDTHNCGSDLTVHTTTASLHESLKEIIAERLSISRPWEPSSPESTEADQLIRLLEAGEIEQAWQVFTNGCDGHEPQIKREDDHYTVEHHDLEPTPFHALVARIAGLLMDGEPDADGHAFDLTNDDAVDTLHSLIRAARALVRTPNAETRTSNAEPATLEPGASPIDVPVSGLDVQRSQPARINFRQQCYYSYDGRQCELCDGHPGAHVLPPAEGADGPGEYAISYAFDVPYYCDFKVHAANANAALAQVQQMLDADQLTVLDGRPCFENECNHRVFCLDGERPIVEGDDETGLPTLEELIAKA